MIVDPPFPGLMNMARDEALFSLYPQKHIPTFRVYQWDGPCLSLGYFQDPREVLDLDSLERLRIPCVRRVTGGAVILHHREITYSMCLCDSDLDLGGSVKDSFKRLTSFLIMFYRKLGLDASFACTEPGARAREGSPSDLCFAANEQYDIIVQGKKIGGNAQKRRKHYILQHGSIPLEIDFDLLKKLVRNVPEDIADRTHGLFDLLEEKREVKTLMAMLTESFLETFGVEKVPLPFSSEEGIWMHKLITTRDSMARGGFR